MLKSNNTDLRECRVNCIESKCQSLLCHELYSSEVLVNSLSDIDMFVHLNY